MTQVIDKTEAAIFGRLIDAEHADLPPELARHILEIQFDDADRACMNELAAKAREGTLTEEERRDLESYNLVGDLLALWHSKARRSLKRSITTPTSVFARV